MTGKNALKSKGRKDQMKSVVPDKDETPTKERDQDDDAETDTNHVRPSS